MRGAIRAILCALLACGVAAASAHPLGNSTVNRWAQLTVSPSGIDIDYVLDLAELPTLVESAAADRDGDGETSSAEWSAYSRRWALGLREALQVQVDGRPLALQLVKQRWRRADGEAGLSVLRLEATLHADYGDRARGGAIEFAYNDRTRAGSFGWKEVVLRATDRVAIVQSTLAREDRSRRLTQYPAAAGYSSVTSGTARIALALATPAAASIAAAAAAPAHDDAKAAPPPSPVIARDRQTDDAAVASARAPRASILASYFRLGMHHIATGWDHLLFLLGLLLLRLELRRIALVVTAFTVAHSLTLGIAAAGWVRPPAIWIEPAIALTIAYVGLLVLVQRGTRHGAVLAFLFGLIHGFGFAGALAESAADHALRGSEFLLSLASFNLGIEAIQLAIVCSAVPLLVAAARRAWFAPAARTVAAGLTLAGVGVFAVRLATA